MMLAIIFLPMTAALLMLAGFCVSVVVRRLRAQRLDWPDDVTFIGMTSRFRQYMLCHGWKVRRSEDIVYHFVVNKSGDDFVVFCSQSDPIYYDRAVQDLIASKRRFGNKTVLFVATKLAPRHLVASAYNDGIYIIHHSQLRDVTAMGQSSIKRLRKLMRDVHDMTEK